MKTPSRKMSRCSKGWVFFGGRGVSCWGLLAQGPHSQGPLHHPSPGNRAGKGTAGDSQSQPQAAGVRVGWEIGWGHAGTSAWGSGSGLLRETGVRHISGCLGRSMGTKQGLYRSKPSIFTTKNYWHSPSWKRTLIQSWSTESTPCLKVLGNLLSSCRLHGIIAVSSIFSAA